MALESYAKWLTMESPDWAKLNIPEIDYQDVYYAHQSLQRPEVFDEVDPELLRLMRSLVFH